MKEQGQYDRGKSTPGKEHRFYHHDPVTHYGCETYDGCRIGAFVDIPNEVKISRKVEIPAFTFIPERGAIEERVIRGSSAFFANEIPPHAVNPDGSLMESSDWETITIMVERGAGIGANVTILCGITIGEHAMVGVGAVVTRDVPAYAILAGVPARVVGNMREQGVKR